MAVTTYCTWTDVTNRISADAAALRVDDASAAAQADILETASVEVNGYLQLNYDVSTLVLSNWVKFKTRDIAVYLLCLRRNHPVPVSVVALYEKAVKDLEKCQLGQMRLPDVPEGKANVPVLSNQRVTLSPFPRVVTTNPTTHRSTGKQEDYIPNNDRYDNFDYSI